MFLKPVAAVLNGKPCVGEKIEVYWSETACRVERLRLCGALRLVDLKENDVRPPPTTATTTTTTIPTPFPHSELLSGLRRSLVANTQAWHLKIYSRIKIYRRALLGCSQRWTLPPFGRSLGVLLLAFPLLLLTTRKKNITWQTD